MRIEQLKQILEVEKYGSVSKAAEALFLAQPVLSRSISTLEKELDAQIFMRTSKGVTPTESGKSILKQAKIVLKEIEKLYQIEQDDSILVGDFYFTLMPALYNALFSELLLLCREHYAGLRPVFYNEGYINALRKIACMQSDIGIVYIPSFPDKRITRYLNQIYGNSELICEEVKNGKVFACVSIRSPIARKTEVSLEEILREKVIIQREDSLKGLGIDLEQCDYIVVEDDWQLLKLVLENKGCAIAPQFHFSDFLESIEESVCKIPIMNQKASYSIYLIYKKIYKTTSLIDLILQTILRIA